ncbi:hypothetical protein VTK73DRAFT_2889 [Phialemonium thermophilum]|uniref:beta-glucosidase n=1 Tax=Phialemonium thermophilum TaxID=223376 RepID=A0ABR3X2Q9_9PEZI
MNPNGTWAAAYAKALALIRQMTNEEKVNVTLGQSGTACTGATGGVPRLGYPGLCFSGSTAGIKQQELVNGYPGGVHSGASWNREMNRERAAAMAREFRAKGMHIQGAPLIGPLGRLPRGGRNNGGFSNDPYLAGQLAAMMVEGISSAGVVSTGKHFVGYEQETYRIRTGDVDPVSSNIDDRTMHELYLWPWADVVRAGMPAVMCSYNKLNNSQACQNSKALNGLLKGELGFQGWVMTDWFALTGGYVAAAAGLDAVMPSPGLWGSNGSSLVEAVQNGSLPAARLDDMAARILTPWFHLGQDAGYTPGGWGATAHFDLPHRKVNARDPASKEVMLRNAMEGHVLVKNANGALPLKKPQMLSVFGYDAAAPRRMNIPSPNDDGFDWSRGNESVDPNSIVQIDGVSYAPAAARNGTLVHAGWSESNAPAYIHAPFDAILEQAYVDGTSLWWDFESENPWVNANSDACLVFINAWATEGQDRSALQDAFSDNLVNNVAANCSNTMVFIHNNWIRLVDAWIDHPNVTAVLFAHLPGQDSGRSLAQLLYGHVSPSGKLPYTVAKAEEDYGDLLPSLPEGRYALYPQSHFSEGIYVDYRHFDKHNITPRFEFGFGLTYTTFAQEEIRRSGRLWRA